MNETKLNKVSKTYLHINAITNSENIKKKWIEQSLINFLNTTVVQIYWTVPFSLRWEFIYNKGTCFLIKIYKNKILVKWVLS